jgi:type IV pilus assembly protein PilP
VTALVLLALLGGGRDPFAGKPSPKPAPDEVCGEELCRFAVSDLKLVALVSGDADPVAMFEDPYGKGMLARRGSRIGKRGGRVTGIFQNCVSITELAVKIDVCLDDRHDLP